MKLRYSTNLAVALLSSLVLTFHADAVTDCGERISRMVCEVAPTKKIQDRFTVNRPCLDKPVGKYKRLLKDAFDKFPAFLQARFCSLEKIYIEDDFFGAAWLTPIDEKNPTRFLIGLRKAELNANLSFPEGRAQFDSQTFGASTKVISYDVAPENHLTSTEFTLIHELGHTFDYENNFNRPATDAGFSKSWTAISWKDIQIINPIVDFPQRSAICLNNCHGKYVSTKEAVALYSELYAHGFLSQLAATNAMEDFADSFAFFIADEILHMGIEADVSSKKFDLHQIARNPAFSKKREFLRKAFKIVD